MNKNASRHQWKSLLKILLDARIPWYLFFLSFIMNAISATLFAELPVILGDIMQGEIFDSSQVTRYSYMSVGSVLFGLASSFVFCYIYLKVNVKSGVGVWSRIIHMPMAVLKHEQPSSLTSRITDDSTGISLALSGIFNGLSSLYGLVIVYIQMFRMNVSLAAMLLFVPVWMLISMKIIGDLSYNAQKKIQNRLSAFTSFLSVRLPNMRQIKAYGTESAEKRVGEHHADEQYQADFSKANVNAISSVLMGVSSTLCSIIVLCYGSVSVARGTMDAGDLLSFFIFVTQGTFANGTETFLMYYQNIKIGLGCCDKIMDIFEQELEKMESEKSFTVPEADIHFDHVSFGYDDQPILKDVSFTIPHGKVTAIVGANGSGKTTILRLLERFYTPDQGSIRYGTDDISKFHLNEWRDSMGYVVQNSPLLQGTVMDNITYGMKEPDINTAIAMAKKVNAFDFILAMENGFDTRVGELGDRLSGGQRQKIAIARAMVANPDVLILDEAATGLDTISEEEINRTFRETMADKTVIMVAHDMTTIHNADQIIVLDQGKVAGVGDHKSLMDSCIPYRNIFCQSV